MANQKLIQSPFAGLGSYVYGDRFVGRNKLVNFLQENCTTRNISIVGLPKIGKTSLVWHSVIENKKDVFSKRDLCVVYFNGATSSTSHKYFVSLIKRVKRTLSLSEILNDADRKRLNDLYKIVKEDDYDNESIQSFFELGICRLPIDIVIFFDEFDKVRNIGFEGHDFSLLRAILGVNNIRGIITSKRTIYTLENWRNDTSSGPSTFYQLFQGNTIRLGQFDDESLTMYWDRLQTYFDNANIELSEKYRTDAIFYAGNHPHVLDVYNAKFYDSKTIYNEIPSEIEIRTSLEDSFKSSIEILEEEGLLDAAIQAVVGPVYNVTEDQINRLVEYDFLKKIKTKDKYKLLGSNLGYVEVIQDGNNVEKFSYVVFSKYFTLLMRKYFINKVDFWQEWTSTFNLLRNLAEQFFIDNWGEEWENATDMDSVIDKMKKLRDIDVISNIPASPCLEYLMETHLGDLIDRNWNTFEKVFSPWSSNDFKNKYEFIKKIRNHHAHLNKNTLTDDIHKEANEYLNEIREKIEIWLKKEENLLIVKNVQFGTISKYDYGTYNIIKWGLKTLRMKPYIDNLNPGDSVQFEVREEPHKDDPNKPYYTAYNVRKIQ